MRATSCNLPDDIRPLFLKLPPEHIVLLKNLLESYEGLAEIRTLDRETGEIVLLALPDTEATLRSVLDSEQPSLAFRYIPTPSSVAADWLLSGAN
ncbi:MAG: DUF4911 domain-containing protein [Bdellovibrionales bacterium]|nr:DUF4911 domain-containing protein [Bdellovibrionales bacterium]